MGKYDKAKGENIVNPNAKMADLKLRQALAYGLDINQMVKAFYDGLREKATSSVPPVFGKYYPKDLAGFPYDPEKAKKLLEKKFSVEKGIRLLGVGVQNVEKGLEGNQGVLFDFGEKKKMALEKAVLKLKSKHPETKIQKARLFSKTHFSGEK